MTNDYGTDTSQLFVADLGSVILQGVNHCGEDLSL